MTVIVVTAIICGTIVIVGILGNRRPAPIVVPGPPGPQGAMGPKGDPGEGLQLG